jgi:hypothetical protein
MALDPADREALRIYADPSISPDEKRRLLGGDAGGIPMPAPLPPDVSGLPPGAVAGPGGGGGGTSGTDDSGQGNTPSAPPAAASSSGAGGAPSVDAISGAQTGVVGGGADIPVTGANTEPSAADQQKVLQQTLSPNDYQAAIAANPSLAGGTGPTQLASTGAPPALPSGPGDYRGALRLMSAPTGAAVPMEHVQQSTHVSQSNVDPGQIEALGEAKQRADADEMQRQIAEARIAQQSGNIQLAAEKQAQAEKIALAATRQQALARADQILAQQDKIGQQIVNTGPIAPGTMSSDNWSDTLFTVLSVFGAVAGASSPEKGAEAVARIANAEVQKQQAALDKNKGDLSALDNLYGKHLENLKDHELAKQATIADIYGRAQAEIMGMIQENGQAPDSLINRKLQAQASALGAQRAEYMADVQAKLGPKIEQQEAVSFVRKHVEPPKPQTAAPVARVPASGAQRATVPAVAARGADGPPKNAEDALNHAADLWNNGKPREALALLPPTVRAAVLAQAARTQKGLGEGATKEDAIAYSLHDLSDGQFKIPESFIPQSAREKLVQIPGGAQGFATSKEQANKLQGELNADQALVSAYSQLEQLTKLPASAWTPELRARIEAITTIIKPMTSVSLGQGAMSTEEQTLYNGVSGGDINSIKDFMLGTGKAAASQALQIARSRIRARTRSLSRDPFDSIPLEGN